MTLKSLIFKDGGGRMGNQWLNMAHLLAFAMENEGRFGLVNVKFWYFAKYFSGSFSNRMYFYPHPQNIRNLSIQFFLKVLDFFPRAVFRSGSTFIVSFLSQMRKGEQIVLPPNSEPMILDHQLVKKLQTRDVVLEGWGFRNWELMEKHATNIRKLIAPSFSQTKKVEKELLPIRQKYKHLVGVFIRQTDYKTWKDGEFYFTKDQYVQWMKVYAERQKMPIHDIAFVIVTDEEGLAEELRKGESNYFVYHGFTLYYYLRNIIRLSQCDVILSPPSTFAALAAFLGQRTMWPLHKNNLGLEDNERIVNSFFDGRFHPQFKIAVN